MFPPAAETKSRLFFCGRGPVRVAFFRGHDDELVELPEDKTGYT